jgi:hypothetical protein
MSNLLTLLASRFGVYELATAPLTVLMIALAVWSTFRPMRFLSDLEAALARIARNPTLSVTLILVFAIGGPLALRPLIGIPDPVIPDEFVLMMQAKTYLRGQFANAALTPNFETPWVLLSPTYAAQYYVLRCVPLVIGYALGIGAWGGVLLSVALLPLAVFWMVRTWISPGFALVAALIVTLRFGLFTLWVNSYMDPVLTALGSVLLVGSYKVLRSRPTLIAGAAFGVGLALLITTRPYDGFLFGAPIATALAIDFVRSTSAARKAAAVPAALALALLAGAVGLTFAQNEAVTGDWKTFPAVLYRDQMSVAPFSFIPTWRPSADHAPRYDWTRRNLDFDAAQYQRRQTARTIVSAETFRFGNYWCFYLGFALTLPFILGLWFLRREPPLLISGALVGFGLAILSFDLSHYASAGFGLVILSVMLGFRALRGWRPSGRPFGLALSRTLPLTLVLAAAVPLRAAFSGPPTTSIYSDNAVNASCCWLWPRSLHNAVNSELDRLGDRHLVIADTGPQSPGDEVLIANDPDLDSARTIWINADPEYDRATIDPYPGRRVWRLSWLDGRPCLQELKAVTSAPGAPLAGTFESLAPDLARGWRPAPTDTCPGGLTRELTSASAKR